MNTLEEQIYEDIAIEVAEKRMRPGVYAKAFAQADGDEKLAVSRYIELRFEQLLAEHKKRVSQQKEAEREAHKHSQQRVPVDELPAVIFVVFGGVIMAVVAWAIGVFAAQ